MARKMWKDYERAIRDYLRGRRIPVTGQEPDGADVVSHCGRFDYQAKRRKDLPVALKGWLDGIRRTANRRGRIGVVVMKGPGDETASSMVTLQANDWLAVLDLLDQGDALAVLYRKVADAGIVKYGERLDRALVDRLTVTLKDETE